MSCNSKSPNCWRQDPIHPTLTSLRPILLQGSQRKRSGYCSKPLTHSFLHPKRPWHAVPSLQQTQGTVVFIHKKICSWQHFCWFRLQDFLKVVGVYMFFLFVFFPLNFSRILCFFCIVAIKRGWLALMIWKINYLKMTFSLQTINFLTLIIETNWKLIEYILLHLELALFCPFGSFHCSSTGDLFVLGSWYVVISGGRSDQNMSSPIFRTFSYLVKKLSCHDPVQTVKN